MHDRPPAVLIAGTRYAVLAANGRATCSCVAPEGTGILDSMDAISFTLCAPADLPAFRRLMHDYLAEFDPTSIYADEEYFAALQRGVQAGTHTIWLARKDAMPVGFALVRIEQQWYRESARIGIFEEFYVAPAFRRQGIGRALVARAVAELRAQGATAISASVVHANMGGLLFWQRLGFTIEAYHLFLTNRS